ncbi:TolB family protein [Micromonospora palythoicola]|uniref:TolB family protein n=1 Tax=Micromonospora palythoicola TaxID=3120507 RepID=UPI002FCE4EB7
MITLVDVAPDGSPGNGGVGGSDISADGRYVAFASTSDNLVPGDVNDKTDIFVRDTQTGVTTLVSGGPDGEPANDWAEYTAVISGNGRYVAFTSSASNLVPDDTNNDRDVFVHDRQTGETTRASVFAGGREIRGISSGATISDNGRYVAFVVTAFAGMDDQGVPLSGQAAFVRDMQTGRTTRVSRQADGGTNLSVFQAAISGDGKRVVFSGSGDWIGDGGTHTGIFVHDRSSGATVRANVPTTGDTLPDGTNPSISRDGTKVTWESYDPYVPADTNGTGDVYVRDLIADTTTLATANRRGTGAGNSYSSWGRIAAGGRYVTYYSSASDLVARDVNGNGSDVFVRDLHTGRTTAVSTTSNGTTGNNESFFGAPSGNGSRIVFMSNATDLGVDPGDGRQHLYLRCMRTC